MEQNLIFTGYHDFKSKKGNQCYVLDFITEPIISNDKKKAFTLNITIFTEEDKYFSFIEKVKLMSLVAVKYEINGDKVRYFI